MAKIVLVKSNEEKPRLFVRSAITCKMEHGLMVEVTLNQPVTMKDGPAITVPADLCFEYDQEIFDEVNKLIMLAEQNIESAKCMVNDLAPFTLVDDQLAQIDWTAGIRQFH